MKALKFRVWDEQNKVFCYINGFNFIKNNLSKAFTPDEHLHGQLVSDPSNSYIKALRSENKIKYSPICQRDPIIQQFTGLKDAGGKDIYEGDLLVDSYESVFEVFWYDVTASFELNPAKEYDWPIEYNEPRFTQRNVTSLKVCGNILEN